MSAVGLRNYIEGALALSELGRGPELVVSYIQEMPLVVKEVGVEAIPDVVTGVMKLASIRGIESRWQDNARGWPALGVQSLHHARDVCAEAFGGSVPSSAPRRGFSVLKLQSKLVS